MSVREENTRKGRSFKVKRTQKDPAYGRYNGESPYQAANKALSEIVRKDEKEGNPTDGEYVFWLIESSKYSKKRVHQYRGRRIKLAEPVEYAIGDSVIYKHYKNELKKIKKEDQEELITKKSLKAKATKKTKKVAKTAKTTKKAPVKTTKKVATAKTTKTTKKVATAKTTKKVAKKAEAPTKAPVKTTKKVATAKTTKKVVAKKATAKK